MLHIPSSSDHHQLFIVSEKCMQSNGLIEIQETQIQQKQAKAHTACRRPIPKCSC